jgi:hypothetical protein
MALLTIELPTSSEPDSLPIITPSTQCPHPHAQFRQEVNLAIQQVNLESLKELVSKWKEKNVEFFIDKFGYFLDKQTNQNRSTLNKDLTVDDIIAMSLQTQSEPLLLFIISVLISHHHSLSERVLKLFLNWSPNHPITLKVLMHTDLQFQYPFSSLDQFVHHFFQNDIPYTNVPLIIPHPTLSIPIKFERRGGLGLNKNDNMGNFIPTFDIDNQITQTHPNSPTPNSNPPTSNKPPHNIDLLSLASSPPTHPLPLPNLPAQSFQPPKLFSPNVTDNWFESPLIVPLDSDINKRRQLVQIGGFSSTLSSIHQNDQHIEPINTVIGTEKAQSGQHTFLSPFTPNFPPQKVNAKHSRHSSNFSLFQPLASKSSFSTDSFPAFAGASLPHSNISTNDLCEGKIDINPFNPNGFTPHTSSFLSPASRRSARDINLSHLVPLTQKDIMSELNGNNNNNNNNNNTNTQLKPIVLSEIQPTQSSLVFQDSAPQRTQAQFRNGHISNTIPGSMNNSPYYNGGLFPFSSLDPIDSSNRPKIQPLF